MGSDEIDCTKVTSSLEKQYLFSVQQGILTFVEDERQIYKKRQDSVDTLKKLCREERVTKRKKEQVAHGVLGERIKRATLLKQSGTLVSAPDPRAWHSLKLTFLFIRGTIWY